MAALLPLPPVVDVTRNEPYCRENGIVERLLDMLARLVEPRFIVEALIVR